MYELSDAARAGDADAVARLLRDRDWPADARVAALTEASQHGHAAVVAQLLEHGTEASASPDPLIWAVRRRHVDVVRLLVAAAADVDATNERMMNLSAVAWAKANRLPDLVRFLIDHRKAAASHPSRFAGRMGLEEPGTFRQLLLVNTSIERAADALVRVTGAARWVRDVLDRDVDTTPHCFLLLQFKGSAWTLCDTVTDAAPATLDDIAPAVARAASAEVIILTSSVTPYHLRYNLLNESGEEVEACYWGQPGVFDLAARYPDAGEGQHRAFADFRDVGGLCCVARRREVVDRKVRAKLAEAGKRASTFLAKRGAYVPKFLRSGNELPNRTVNVGMHYPIDPWDVERVDFIAVK